MRSHRFHATRVLVFLLAVASLVAATRPTPALADALSDLYGCQYDREEVYVGDGESGDATAAIVSEGSSDGDGSARSVQTVAPREISGEMLYFCTWESGQNYDQGLSWGDGYAAMGYFQFDRGSDLGAFLHAVYNYDPTTYSCLRVIGDRYGWNLSEKAAGPTRSNGAFTQLGNDLNAAWHACYKANPTEFSQLQNGWAYDNYYVPAANYMRSRGIPIDNRSDSVKSLCWGMSNLFGTGGWRKFVGGRTNGYDWNGNWNSSKDWPGAGLAADMSDEEFVATLCDYVVDNVSVFYKAQPQYWDGWRNRYRSEKAHYLQVIAENEASSRQALDELADANRSTLADGEYVVRARCAGRLVLDVYGGYSSAGTNVQLWEPNSTDGQVWEVSHDEAGYVTLTCAGSGKVLDVWGGSPRAGANAQQWDPTGGWNQKWVAVPGQDGGVTLVSAMRSDLALDVYGGYSAAGTNVQLWTATGGASQSFEFIAAHPDIAPGSRLVSLEGVWSDIVPVCADGLALDVYGGYSAVGTNVQTWTPSGTLGQAFRLEWRDGYYAIVNAASGLAIGSAGQGVVPGANACLCDPGTAGDGALFAATDNGDGTVTFVNKATGLALDIYGGYSAAGTNVQLWTATGGASQRFSVEPRSHVLGEGAYTIASPSGLLIDLSHGSDEDGAQAVLFSPNEGLNQRWYLTPVDGRDGVYTVESLASAKRLAAGADGSVSQRAASDDASQWWRVDVETGYVRLESVSSPGTRLAAGGGSGARVGLSSANDPSTQRFSLAPAEAALPTGTYVVRPASDPSLALDVYGASLANGANVQAWGFSDGGNQKWRLSPAAGGAFAVTNCLSGKALDVQGGSATPGANVEQFSPNGGANQRWRVTYRPGGWVLVSELDSSLVLTLSGGAASGSNAVVDRDSGAADQRFTFRRTTYVPSDRQEMVWKAQGYYSSTNWLILVDNTDNKVGIFNGSRGNWNLVQYWTCTTGKASTPTVLGEYQVGSRGYSFGSGFTCYYWTQFYHDYLFHSIPYDENTFRVQDGRLGQNLSHGCVRLDINNAKWIYDNIPTRTKVVSYR